MNTDQTATGTTLLEVKLAALTRVEYSEIIVVPSDITQTEIDALVDKRYEDVDGSDYWDDPEYWSRGNCEATPPDMPDSPTLRAFRQANGMVIKPLEEPQSASPSLSPKAITGLFSARSWGLFADKPQAGSVAKILSAELDIAKSLNSFDEAVAYMHAARARYEAVGARDTEPAAFAFRNLLEHFHPAKPTQ